MAQKEGDARGVTGSFTEIYGRVVAYGRRG